MTTSMSILFCLPQSLIVCTCRLFASSEKIRPPQYVILPVAVTTAGAVVPAAVVPVVAELAPVVPLTAEAALVVDAGALVAAGAVVAAGRVAVAAAAGEPKGFAAPPVAAGVEPPAGFGVSVALLPPQAARIAAAAVPARLPRKCR